MSKPTYIQREICRTIESLMYEWIDSNDFSSPSHNTLIEESFNSIVFDDNLSQEHADKLADMLQNLHWYIDKIKE